MSLQSVVSTITRQRISKWPNLQTLCTSTSSIIYGVEKYFNTPWKFPFVLSRAANAFYHRKSIAKLCIDATALVLLFFPYGRLIAVAADAILECLNIYENITAVPLPPLMVRLKQGDIQGAYKLLNISEDQQKNSSVIKENYLKLKTVIKGRQSSAKASIEMKNQLGYFLSDIELAYKMITQQSDSSSSTV